jgi:hypothetical protein
MFFQRLERMSYQTHTQNVQCFCSIQQKVMKPSRFGFIHCGKIGACSPVPNLNTYISLKVRFHHHLFATNLMTNSLAKLPEWVCSKPIWFATNFWLTNKTKMCDICLWGNFVSKFVIKFVGKTWWWKRTLRYNASLCNACILRYYFSKPPDKLKLFFECCIIIP